MGQKLIQKSEQGGYAKLSVVLPTWPGADDTDNRVAQKQILECLQFLAAFNHGMPIP